MSSSESNFTQFQVYYTEGLFDLRPGWSSRWAVFCAEAVGRRCGGQQDAVGIAGHVRLLQQPPGSQAVRTWLVQSCRLHVKEENIN
jgi:hypothetical protein